MEDIMKGLNSVQKEAVETTDGPLLLLAGAGTGKTKVLTSRIANIILKGLARPSEILAVTFTNKAATEMKHRISNLVYGDGYDWWVGTFHGIALRILKQFYSYVGLQDKFIILDTEDVEKIFKQILEDSNIDPKAMPIKFINNTISRLKDKGITAEEASKHNNVWSSFNLHGSVDSLQSIYLKYQQRLQEMNAVDFGDLLMLCVELFKKHPEVLNHYQDKFQYILVDEYQDTNIVQYLFLKALAFKHHNICCVGDDDQSIYSWRGAEIVNILRFSEDYKDAKVLRLEQNYRSTTNILGAATSLVTKNNKRWGKELWTDKKNNSKVKVIECTDSNSESRFIVEEIKKIVNGTVENNQDLQNQNYSDIAVLVRAGFQTRSIEEKLLRENIPYKIVGGNKFYERMEIKDSVAYLRLIYQLSDDMAFFRIINTPKRGVGPTTIAKIREVATSNRMSMFKATEYMLSNGGIPPKLSGVLSDFVMKINFWNANINNESLAVLAQKVLEEFGYINYWREEKTEESKTRLDNINELLNSLTTFVSLEQYLEHISLVLDVDEKDDQNKVSLMTLHAAKGLEFNTVFLSGWEEGVFPSARSVEESGENALEEERRLAYVGITRAKLYAVISYSKNRIVYGNMQPGEPSRFIKEIDQQFIKHVKQASYKSPFIDNNSNSFSSSFKGGNTFSQPQEYIHKLAKGTRVMHQTYGYGVVESQGGAIVTVNFEDFGEKSIKINFLEKI